MADFISEYVSMTSGISAAITEALSDMASELIADMKSAAVSEVYSYSATEMAMRNRRGTIADEDNFDVYHGENYIRITNTAQMQGTDYGVTEADFVIQGLPNYKQPYPRDFMEKVMEDYLRSGRADTVLRNAMQRHGIDYESTGSSIEGEFNTSSSRVI